MPPKKDTKGKGGDAKGKAKPAAAKEEGNI